MGSWCRPIRSVIILAINKSDSRYTVVRFCYHSHDNRPNWTPLSPITYILLDGLSYNTRGYFASCVVVFRAPQGRGKLRAMSKMSASIICCVKPSNKRFIIPLQKGVILIQFYLVRMFFKKMHHLSFRALANVVNSAESHPN